ncbi:SMC-Scp complex subunit ScpB [Micromonospora auratinigra]|uniref:Segregation and condensation protein B n=1 Tax=Micromonospora auratinigra TaxID=261654 RepID=A0A1A8Z460_9ACTN|nr:SMC-Scp complex subunit ScpB [Micromonospora auratinigra]SBT38646.1 segregation and condensation protein B [Micromonospora auratinigra]
MSDEERRDSLADQAAAWIPPWERPTPPKPAPPADEAGPSAPVIPNGDSSPNPATDPDPATAPEPGAVAGPGGNRAVDEPDSVPVPADAADSATSAATGGVGESGHGVGPDTVAGDSGVVGGVPARRGRRRAAPVPEPAPELDDAELRGALEAILLVVDQPVSELTLAQVLDQAPERIGPMLDDIAAGYTAAGHGFELRRAAGGWRLYTRPEYATYVERFVLEGQTVRLTQAALETLAVIAYRQPVTRSRISAIRGVNCDGVIRTLVTRGLIEEAGTETDSGAFLYRTTTMFLEKLGLNSVDDLPPLAPFLPDDVEELADATR